MQRWLILMYSGVAATLEGPFADEEARLARARAFRDEDGADEHSVHRLDIDDHGRPTVADCAAREVDPAFGDEVDDEEVGQETKIHVILP